MAHLGSVPSALACHTTVSSPCRERSCVGEPPRPSMCGSCCSCSLGMGSGRSMCRRHSQFRHQQYQSWARILHNHSSHCAQPVASVYSKPSGGYTHPQKPPDDLRARHRGSRRRRGSHQRRCRWQSNANSYHPWSPMHTVWQRHASLRQKHALILLYSTTSRYY
jgi:hypothetical protein